ncbi:MAG: hypothetical protein IJ783_10385 [Kiritimatiellae bacterium]|nr:hypothetical protein [Kiritimatiellia bacterium]
MICRRTPLAAAFFAAALAVAGATGATGAASTTYDRVYSALSALPHRRVGSAEAESAARALESELSAAGLQTHRETFASLAQTTKRCTLSLDGVPIEGAMPIDYGPAGLASPEAAPFTGPAVYAGDGSLEAIEGKALAGAVAVVDATIPGASVREAFAHGAAAAVLVGGPDLDPWKLGGVAFESVSQVPRVYVPRDSALRAGLLSEKCSGTLALDVRTDLEDVRGFNVWAAIPGREDWSGDLGGGEVLVLSATLDTYGLVPDFCPDLRRAANCALLAQTAADLAAGPRPARTVVVAFFGSVSGGQEGARHFYHAAEMADRNANPAGFAKLRAAWEKELAQNRGLLEASADADPLGARGAAARDFRLLLKKDLAGLSGEIRSRLSSLREAAASGGDAAVGAAAEIEALDARRAACNELRSRLVSGRASKDAPAGAEELLAERVAEVRRALEARGRELETRLADCATWEELSRVFEGRHFVAHFDFDFADARSPWMLSMANSVRMFRHAGISTGDYRRYLSAVREIYYGAPGSDGGVSAGRNWEAPLHEPALSPAFKPFSLSFPRQRLVPTSPSAGAGVGGFQMVTVGDPLLSDNMPAAVPCDLSALAPQMAEVCRAFAESPALSQRPVYTPSRMETRLLGAGGEGLDFREWAPGSTDDRGVPRGAVANLAGYVRAEPLPGVSDAPRARVGGDGRVYVPFVARDWTATASSFSDVVVGHGPDGVPDRISADRDSHSIPSTPVHLFHAFGGLSWNDGYAPDPVGGDAYQAQTFVARKDSPHKTFARVSLAADGKSRTEFFADRPDPVKIVGANGELLLGSRRPEPGEDPVKAASGAGVPLDAASRLRSDNVARAAEDAYALDDARLAVLRSRNIVRDDLERVHADAKDHVDAAAEAARGRKWALSRAHSIFATCLENRIYRPLRGVTEDLVRAVVVLLLLNIPFAFAMERLVFGFTSVYKQIGGFVGVFLATFGILYATHPAFSLASAPVVIFLAFVIIMLGVATTAIMAGKIKEEIRKMQGLSSTVHGVQAESSTTLSAILIGMAGMRNRPLKTVLTCATVVLLTFTILVFASFGGEQGVVETDLGRGAGADRIELHRLSFLSIDDDFAGAALALYGDRYRFARRGGIYRDPTKASDSGDEPISPERVFLDPRSGASLRVGAVMGFDGCDSELPLPALPEGFPEGAAPAWLPPAAADAMPGLRPGDELRLNGRTFAFAGFFDAAALQGVSTIDGLKAVPPDFQATLAAAGRNATAQTGADTLERIDTGSFEWFPADVVALARMSDLRAAFPGECQTDFLALYPVSPEADVDADAARLAPVFQGTVHSKSASGARRHFFAGTVRGSGFADVAVPLLLGGLIIFSSLMGSIVAREKEIFTYSALGLAPVDVGALFFAESAVYSVIGGMGGYLLSQLVAKGLALGAAHGWFVAPEMNFSSLASVSTILVVMAVVMLSTIYPAMRAGKSANPGVARKWKMPRADGDNLRFAFPFTVSAVDFAGILSFLREHFENHADATLGAFSARDVELWSEPDPERPGEKRSGISAKVSLAPFDLGIFQDFRMHSRPSDIGGIDEVVVEIRRLGGTPEAWQRGNRGFAAELREQFLLWRSLPIATVEHYRAATAAALGGAAAARNED